MHPGHLLNPLPSHRSQLGCVAQYITLRPFAPTPFRLCRYTVLGLLIAREEMRRRKGSVNYKNEALIKIIEGILPNGEYGWDAVATAYQKVSNEEASRDTADLKKHWMRNLCNNMKKPTGGTGERGDRINRCIAIERKIMEKTNSGLLGFSSEDENHDEESSVEGEGGVVGEEDSSSCSSSSSVVPMVKEVGGAKNREALKNKDDV